MNVYDDTPCVHICAVNQDHVCIGCHLTLQEMVRWPKADERERQDILSRAEKRREEMWD
ncbi:MAG: DUF1289 domain-containing protein [Gammaproteobacteria bacterium]|nr:DUF1289 domain-containing protein [Gammaproteobacteria bacterium]|tara:strand:+ start:1751 stop:1927 length:177 start_codon:yes stop_codon:yes gene_type:complete